MTTKADTTNLSVEELKSQLAEAQANYSKAKLLHKVSPLENPIQIRDLRRNIARLQTALTNKQ